MVKKTQVEKFREAAKEAGTDDSEERFDKTLKDLAKAPREAGPQELPSSADAGEADASPHQKPKSS
jgi:hypothetical protein